MNIAHFLMATMLLAVTARIACATEHQSKPNIATAEDVRPNILFIISDDQERQEFNFLPEGRDERDEPRNLSPNLDRLAVEGVVFPNQYVTSPVCTPSRFTILSERPGGRGSEGPAKEFYPNYYDRDQLYNITTDPLERNNLFDDKSQQVRVREMQQLLREAVANVPGSFAEFRSE